MNKVFVVFLVLGVSVLSACTMYQEGNLNSNRVRVEQDKFFEDLPAADVDEAYIRGLGRYYTRHGDGPVALSVVYDSGSSSNTAMKASHILSRLIKDFRVQGMTELDANILPVRDLGDEARVIVSFTSYTAMAPKDCGVLAGFNDTKIDTDPNYKMGCTVETVFARQISRPKDLIGQAQTDPTSEGRRVSNSVEIYRSGTPNQPLEGESASGE